MENDSRQDMLENGPVVDMPVGWRTIEEIQCTKCKNQAPIYELYERQSDNRPVCRSCILHDRTIRTLACDICGDQCKVDSMLQRKATEQLCRACAYNKVALELQQKASQIYTLRKANKNKPASEEAPVKIYVSKEEITLSTPPPASKKRKAEPADANAGSVNTTSSRRQATTSAMPARRLFLPLKEDQDQGQVENSTAAPRSREGDSADELRRY